jgi:hypothetical protein
MPQLRTGRSVPRNRPGSKAFPEQIAQERPPLGVEHGGHAVELSLWKMRLELVANALIAKLGRCERNQDGGSNSLVRCGKELAGRSVSWHHIAPGQRGHSAPQPADDRDGPAGDVNLVAVQSPIPGGHLVLPS